MVRNEDKIVNILVIKKLFVTKKIFHKKDAQRQTKIIFRFQIRKFLVFRSGTYGSDYEQVRYLIEIKSKYKMFSKYLFKLTVISGNFFQSIGNISLSI